MLLGQWLATAELAKIFIIAIVFRFIKPLCRSLTLGIACSLRCGVCSLPKLACRSLTLTVARWCRKRRGAHAATDIGLMKPLCHIPVMIRHTISIVWVVPPCHILISKMLTGDAVEIVDVDIDVVTVVLPAVAVTMTAIVMIIIIVMMMMVMIVVIPVDAAE